MQAASSASLTCIPFRSATECTATVLMPMSRQARMIRTAISPRFAINIFLNMILNFIFFQYGTTAGRIRQVRRFQQGFQEPRKENRL